MKRHGTDVVSLLFGLLFIALSAWWAVAYYLDWTVNWNVPNFGWIAAGVLIVVGLFGVVASLRRDRPEPALVEGTESFDKQPWAENAATEPETVDDLGPPDSGHPDSGPQDSGPQDSGSRTVDLGPADSTPTDVRRDDRD